MSGMDQIRKVFEATCTAHAKEVSDLKAELAQAFERLGETNHALQERIAHIQKLEDALAEAKRDAEVAKEERNKLSNQHREIQRLKKFLLG